jgi:hypothetical protein
MTRPQAGTAVSGFGVAVTAAGTASTPALGSATLWERTRRTRFATAAAAAQSASGRTNLFLMPGSSAQDDGYRVCMRFGFAAFVAGQRCFVGLQSSAAAIGNVEPDTLASMVAVVARSSDARLQLCNRRGGAAELIDLGADFPVGLLNVPLELELANAPGTELIEYRVQRMDSGVQVVGTLSGSQIPGQNTQLAAHCWIHTGALSSAAQIELAPMDAWSY